MTAPLSRRAALQAAGGVALSLLPGCADGERPTVGLYNWDSYVAPRTLAAFEAATGTAVVLSAPAGSGVNHWGAVPDSFALMQRVKDRFDPERRLSPGRLLGGL